MRIPLLLAAAGLATLAACSEAPTAPTRVEPGARRSDITCASGFIVATMADGTQACVPAQQAAASAPALP